VGSRSTHAATPSATVDSIDGSRPASAVNELELRPAITIAAASSTSIGSTTEASTAAQLNRCISHDASDQKKAALIMQVLKLTDEQIAMLPAEQRASILVLKELIAKTANR
jgi:hypothetical protein